MSLLTMIIYPRVVEVIFRMLYQKGYIRDFKYSGKNHSFEYLQ